MSAVESAPVWVCYSTVYIDGIPTVEEISMWICVKRGVLYHFNLSILNSGRLYQHLCIQVKNFMFQIRVLQHGSC